MKRYLRYIIPAALLIILGVAVTLFLILPGDGGGDTNPSDSEAPEQPSGTEETVRHKLHDYFVLENEAEGVSFSSVTQYEGTLEEIDTDNNLIALLTEDLDTKNQVTKTVNVYDLLSGEVILTDSVTYGLGSVESKELSVMIDYPIIRVKKTSHHEDADSTVEISYYFAKKDSSVICSTTVDDEYDPYEDRTDFRNGLSAISMAGKVYWIDRDMEILRNADLIAANGYDVEYFNEEYEGYLYAFGYNKIQVFNRLGICSGEYQIAHDGYLTAFVLNNGNVLIQEFESVEAHENYDVMLYATRYVVKSYVMSFMDGTMTPVDLGFVVEELESAYGQEYGTDWLPFNLAEGKENQAIIYRFANGSLSLYQEYVVLTNDLTVEYTVQNTLLGVDFRYVSVIDSNLYNASVQEGGGWQEYLFDLDGNIVSPLTSGYYYTVSDSYIATETGIYNHKMEKILDLVAGEFGGCKWVLDEFSDRVYLWKHNHVTHADETYVLTADATEPVLLCDGVDTAVESVENGYYVLYDHETGELRYCNVAGEVKLVIWGYDTEYNMEEGMLVKTTFEGRSVFFFVR